MKVKEADWPCIKSSLNLIQAAGASTSYFTISRPLIVTPLSTLRSGSAIDHSVDSHHRPSGLTTRIHPLYRTPEALSLCRIFVEFPLKFYIPP